ncbi:MAG: MMPL family transporter [Pirellulales bacterium]|nr:MMPL family transporter [Pirellulales bacterium]
MNKPSFIARYATHILIASAIITPLACFGAIKAIKGNRNDVSDWLPKSYPETIELRWFRKHFVADQFVIISWDGCTLGDDPAGADDDPRIARLTAELLASNLPQASEHPGQPVFKQVTTARDVMRQLMAPPTSLSQRQAKKRLTGSLIGPDGRQTALVATLTEAGAANLRESVGRPIKKLIRTTPVTPLFKAINAAGLSASEVRLGGPPIDNVAIDEEGERTLVRLAGLSGLLGISLAYLSLRSVRMTAIVFYCGILSAAVSLATVPLLGSRMDAILMSMPALIYVLAVSGAVHLINYYRQAAADEGKLDHAVEHAVAHAWRPAILTSVTTAIGLASLLTSDIIPIAKFGGFSAIGTMTMLAILFLVLPASLKRWPWTPPELLAKGGHGQMRKKEEGPSFGARGWNAFGGFVRRHHAAVLGACMAVIVVLCFGLPKTRTSIDLLKLFSEDARLLKDYEWFEAHLGKIVPMELVVRFAPEVQREAAPPGASPGELVTRHTFFERLKLVERIQQNIDRQLGPGGLDLVGATMSAATFAPNLGGQESGLNASTYRERANEQLLESRAEFARSGYFRVEGPDAGDNAGEELWRISVRLAAFHGMDHGELVGRIRDAVQPALEAREMSVDALESLAERRHGRPNGARVVVLRPASVEQNIDDVLALLTTKNVRAQAGKAELGALSDEQLQASLSGFDGVVTAAGFSYADYEQIRRAGVPLLATQVAARDEARDTKSVLHDITGVDVTYTGVVPVVYKAQHALLESLVQSTWWSFATILPLMMWVCHGFWAGVVVMIPNTLPVLVVFGGMGWLGIPVDIGSMMAASIALGVAVDDTIHFLAWYKDDLKALGDRHEAVLSSYRRSASATLQAGLINGLGLSVFATSSFTPTQRFGWLMLTILVAGITAELIMLPALMFGPIGQVFSLKPRKERRGPLRVRTRDDSLLSPLDRRRLLREHGASVEA